MSPSPSSLTASLLSLAGVRYRYPGASFDALAALDLDLEPGEFLAVVGANGSGKSTLARLLGGLEPPTAAQRALVCGCDLLSEEGRYAARREVGVLFQNPENQLVAECVEADVAFGLENLAWPSGAIAERVDEMLERFALGDLRHREPHLLSGGQKQRVALAGVLAIPRQLIVLDEPTAMLDPAGRREVGEAVRLLRREGMAVVYITQEMGEVVEADSVLAIERGSVAFRGSVRGFFRDVELVRRMRLGVPTPTELGLALEDRGGWSWQMPLTLEELLEGLAVSQ